MIYRTSAVSPARHSGTKQLFLQLENISIHGCKSQMLVSRGETSTQVSSCHKTKARFSFCLSCRNFITKWNENSLILGYFLYSLRKQPTFGNTTTGFPAKWHLRNEKFHSASDWSCHLENLIQPIRSATQI